MKLQLNGPKLPSEWNRGVLHTGEEADEPAYELIDGEDLLKYTKIYSGPDLTTDEKSLHITDASNTDRQFGAYLNLSVPVSHGFMAAAKAGCDNTRRYCRQAENTGHSVQFCVAYGEVLSNVDDMLEAKEQDNEKFAEAGADLKLADVGITANISGKRAHDIIKKTENNLKNARVIGGDGTKLLSEGLSKWITTIKSNQKVVFRTNLRPTYSLLDSERKKRVISIYECEEHRDHIPYGTILNMRHINYGRYLYVDNDRHIRDESHGTTYRGKVLFAFKEFESRRNPLKVKFRHSPRHGQPHESYVKIIGDPKHGPGIYLGLANAGIKTDKVASSHQHEPKGRYLAGKFREEAIAEDFEISWRLELPEESDVESKHTKF
ncbi:hypothetical protein DFQ28_004466 [Apophysomyces sp. BC1034]|nr:hypothetical protein DFQ29_001580 [Apophysomyces sp. BC1021]KAG0193574.1 hypothetical protein DFQ28_004466 [Apophysomyces sp. BC1034]